MGQPNWAKLEAEGRCKRIGIPWTTEEREAIYILKIPYEYVRDGITTLEAYQSELEEQAKTGKKPLKEYEREELYEMAEELGVKLTPDISKATLIIEITDKKGRKKQAAQQLKAVNKAYQIEADERAKDVARQQKEIKKAKEEKKDEPTKPIFADKLEAEAQEKVDALDDKKANKEIKEKKSKGQKNK